MKYVDVLITTEEDTRVVFGMSASGTDEQLDAEPYEETARALETKYDLDAVAVTLPLSLRSSWSAVVAAEGKTYRAPRHDVHVIDRIGAGDAFSAGLIVGRLENRGWDDAVRFASAAAALKHTIPGDFCLVTRGEVDQLLGGANLRVSR